MRHGDGLVLACALAWASSACETPSSSIDGGDLRGVFERDGAADASTDASADASAKRRKDAGAEDAGAARTRTPGAGGCLTPSGTAAADVRRTVGRPACRNSLVLEDKDSDGAPRYACVVIPPGAAQRAPLPLVLWFHAEWEDPSFLDKVTGLRKHASKFDLARDPQHAGFVVLSVQGRALGKRGTVFDTAYTGPDNVDFAMVDKFVEAVGKKSVIDPKRVYAIGSSQGGVMAATYAMARSEKIAAFAALNSEGPASAWGCSSPPPPAFVAYHACDDDAPCEKVEKWLLALEGLGADVGSVRLGEADEVVPHCALRNKCSKKKARAEHQRWPKRREVDMLTFLSRHALAH